MFLLDTGAVSPTQTDRHLVACQWLESWRQADLHLGLVTLAERARGIARPQGRNSELTGLEGQTA